MRFFLILLLLGGLGIYVFSQPRLWGPVVYPLQHRESIKTYTLNFGLEPNLVAAVIFAESRFFAGRESRAGARGLMQLLPTTAADVADVLGEADYTADSLFEPDRNIRYGTFYLKYLHDKYGGDLDLTLAAYNAGETNVDRWVKENHGEILFAETADFVANVKKAREMYDRIYGKWYENE